MKKILCVGDLALDVISQLKQKWENFYPSDPFDFQYISETYKLQLKNDENLAMLSMIYTIFSIILATLGLYGLAANSARKRVKEIGDPDLVKRIADETNATTSEELLKFLNEVKHPALEMEPMI